MLVGESWLLDGNFAGDQIGEKIKGKIKETALARLPDIVSNNTIILLLTW